MPLFGTLSTMPLPDLLQWLGTARCTGTLQIERNKVIKSILFDKGRVVGCSSDDPPERLGQFLLSHGKITEEQLRSALRDQERSGRHLGMILVGMKALSEADLTEHLAAKAEETIYSIFDWDNAVFRFHESVSELQNVLPVSLQVEDILLRGLRRFDEMRMIREVFHSHGIVLRQTPRLPPPEVFHNKMARQVYESINGERTVAEILLIAHGSEYLVTKFLFELHRNGFLEILEVRDVESPGATAAPTTGPAGPGRPERESAVGERDAVATAPPVAPAGSGGAIAPAAAAAATAAAPVVAGAVPASEPEAPAAPAATTAPRPQPAPAPHRRSAHPSPDPTHRGLAVPQGTLEERLAAARHLTSRGEFDAALDLLDELYANHPQNESLRRLSAEVEAAFVEHAYRHYLPAAHVPVLTRPVEQLEAENISPTEFYLLSRIDGSWDIKSIVQITPLREVESLRTLKRMRETGVIELREPDSADPP